MTTMEFDSQPSVLAPAATRALPLRRASRSARTRLAVVSTHDDLCGIAAYTRSLERQLGDVFDVTVFQLNQFLLRSTHRRVRRFGDKHIQAICREIRHYDTVNLQLEHGTLGHSCGDIFRRFNWIVRASPRLSVTFHSIMLADAFDFAEWLREICRFNFTKAITMRSGYMRANRLSAGIARRLRRAQRFKPVALVVHTRRDLWHMKYVHGMRNVYDHPLSFIDVGEAQEIRRTASRAKFPVLDAVPAQSKLIGVFGFIGRYKGFDTVIRALHHLPEEYHLLIFGGVHPNEIKAHQSIDPVVSSLFEAGYIDTSVAERTRANSGTSAPVVSVAVDGSMRDLLVEHPKNLSARIPYLEVGQSSSGPISQSLELGCRVIASRSRTFLQFGRYHQNMIEFFDIGNHLELAGLILARPRFDTRERLLAFNVETNKETYL